MTDPKSVVIRTSDDGTAQTGERGIFKGNDTMAAHTAIHIASLSDWRLVSAQEVEGEIWLRFEETPMSAAEALVANVEKDVITNIESDPAINIELRTVFIGMTEAEMTHHLTKLGWRKVGLARGLVFYTRDIDL